MQGYLIDADFFVFN